MLRWRCWVFSRFCWILAGVAAVYVLTAWAGRGMALRLGEVVLVWPLAGLGLGAILLLGSRIWPGVLAGALLAQVIFLHQGGLGPDSMLAALSAALGATLEALGGGWLVRRFAAGRAAFEHPQTILIFAALAGGLGAMIGATLGVAGALAGESVPASQGGWLLFLWWLNDLTGIVVMTPVLMVWNARRGVQSAAGWVETLILATGLVLVCLVVFGGWFSAKSIAASLFVLLVPLLLWGALRWGIRRTALSLAAVAYVCLYNTMHHQGLFRLGGDASSALLAQECMVVLAVMSLALAADVLKRRESEIEARLSEGRYRELFRDNPQPLVVYDCETLKFLAVNDAAVCLYGYERKELLQMGMNDLLRAEERGNLARTKAEEGREGEVSARRSHCRKNGSLVDVEVSWHHLVFNGRSAAMAMITDLTERKHAEQRATAFSNLGRRLSAAASAEAAAWIIAETAEEFFSWEGFSFDVYNGETDGFARVLRLENVGGVRRRVAGQEPVPDAQASRRRVLQQGAQLVLRSGPAAAQPAPASVRRPFPLSLMVVPVRRDQRVVAVLTIQSRSSNAYGQNDLWILQALADHCAGALDRIQAQTACREKEEWLHLALAAGKMGTWVVELQGDKKIVLSQGLAALLEISSAEMVLTVEALMARIHPDDRERTRIVLNGSDQRRREYEVEFRLMPRTRPMVWVLARGRVWYDAEDRPVRLVGIAIDITERRLAEQEIRQLNDQLEQRVLARTVQLEAANRELEAFSYSVSHDLRAPLRSIQGFSQVVLERYLDKIDACGQGFLRRICESSQYMNQLIEDLLKLSRVGRAELRQEPVDLSAMAGSIAGELKEAEPERKVEWVIAPQLTTQGDARLLHLVLENLLRNAWKFTEHQAQPRIEIGFQNGGKSAFFVRDNGAGFDMNMVHRLFGVFQRLHSTNEFPGTGVGLATVQRIIHRHGGRVWACGAINQGATFYFTLPTRGSI